MKVRSALFWLFLVLFVGLSVWWVFYLPFDRESVYRAIPLNAVFVSEHEKVAERWEAIAKNPLTQCLLSSCGMDVREVKQAIADPEVADMVRRYAARDTVVAYVPSLGQSGQPAWVLASWAGGQGQVLRLVLSCGGLSGFKKLAREDGRPVWCMATTRDRSGLMMSIVAVQGVLVGCLSLDPFAARDIADRVERHALIESELRERLDSVGMDGHRPDILDQGWLDWAWISGGTGRGRMHYALVAHGESESVGWIRGTTPLPAGPPLRDTVDASDLERLLGDTPDALVVIPSFYLEPFLSGTNRTAAWTLAQRFVRNTGGNGSSVFVSMSGGPFSGRVFGLRVPTVLAGMNVTNVGTVLDQVADCIDQVNQQYKMGLVPNRTLVQGRPAMALGFSRNDLFASLNPEERPAFVVATNWLVLSSNVDALGKVLGQRTNAGAARWRGGMERVSDATAYAWIDLESAHQALKNAVAVYTLSLLVKSREGQIEERDQLRNMSGWIDSLRSLKTCRLWLKSDASGFDLEFAFGAPR